MPKGKEGTKLTLLADLLVWLGKNENQNGASDSNQEHTKNTHTHKETQTYSKRLTTSSSPTAMSRCDTITWTQIIWKIGRCRGWFESQPFIQPCRIASIGLCCSNRRRSHGSSGCRHGSSGCRHGSSGCRHGSSGCRNRSRHGSCGCWNGYCANR
jgi:hypothetical protein